MPNRNPSVAGPPLMVAVRCGLLTANTLHRTATVRERTAFMFRAYRRITDQTGLAGLAAVNC